MKTVFFHHPALLSRVQCTTQQELCFISFSQNLILSAPNPPQTCLKLICDGTLHSVCTQFMGVSVLPGNDIDVHLGWMKITPQIGACLLLAPAPLFLVRVPLSPPPVLSW